jgi:hypothetical protein
MSIVKNIMDEDYVNLQKAIEKKIADKIWNRVTSAKVDILAKMNGVSREDQEKAMKK